MKSLLLLCLLPLGLLAQAPVVSTFTATPASVVAGATVQLCWTATNAPTSVTIATRGSTVSTSALATGCATITPPTNGRVRFAGDSLSCSLRSTGTPPVGIWNTSLPCSPNPNPNGSTCCSFPAIMMMRLAQMGYYLPTPYANLGVVGAVTTNPGGCTGSGYNPDIVFIDFGANDLQNKTTNAQADTFVAALQTVWDSLVSSGCRVFGSTIMPRGNFTDSVRVYANGRLLATYAAHGLAVMSDPGSDANIGCSSCNLSTTYFNSDNTHMTDFGYAYLGTLNANAIAASVGVLYTVTATNGSGSGTATALVPVMRPRVTATSTGGTMQ